MKTGFVAALGLGFLTLLVPERVCAQSAAAGTRYPLVLGSTYTAGGKAPLVPLRGALFLLPKPGPLDWEHFSIETARLETGDPAAPVIWRGSGNYARVGRGVLQQRLELELTDGLSTVRFDSGTVPLGDAGPELDLVAVGDAVPAPQIHLQAVPELARWRYRRLM